MQSKNQIEQPGMTANVIGRDRCMRTVGIVMAGVAVYATARYNVFKGVDWIEWPIYVANKVFALSSLILLAIYVIQGRRVDGGERPGVLTSAWGLMLLHVTLSLVILNPAYFPKYFAGEKLTVQAGVSMLLGALAALGVHMLSRSCTIKNGPGWLMKIAWLAFFVGLHAALLGYASWLVPSSWPGNLPPITLVSLLCGGIALLAGAMPARRGTQERPRA